MSAPRDKGPVPNLVDYLHNPYDFPGFSQVSIDNMGSAAANTNGAASAPRPIAKSAFSYYESFGQKMEDDEDGVVDLTGADDSVEEDKENVSVGNGPLGRGSNAASGSRSYSPNVRPAREERRPINAVRGGGNVVFADENGGYHHISSGSGNIYIGNTAGSKPDRNGNGNENGNEGYHYTNSGSGTVFFSSPDSHTRVHYTNSGSRSVVINPNSASHVRVGVLNRGVLNHVGRGGNVYTSNTTNSGNIIHNGHVVNTHVVRDDIQVSGRNGNISLGNGNIISNGHVVGHVGGRDIRISGGNGNNSHVGHGQGRIVEVVEEADPPTLLPPPSTSGQAGRLSTSPSPESDTPKSGSTGTPPQSPRPSQGSIFAQSQQPQEPEDQELQQPESPKRRRSDSLDSLFGEGDDTSDVEEDVNPTQPQASSPQTIVDENEGIDSTSTVVEDAPSPDIPSSPPIPKAAFSPLSPLSPFNRPESEINPFTKSTPTPQHTPRLPPPLLVSPKGKRIFSELDPDSEGEGYEPRPKNSRMDESMIDSMNDEAEDQVSRGVTVGFAPVAKMTSHREQVEAAYEQFEGSRGGEMVLHEYSVMDIDENYDYDDDEPANYTPQPRYATPVANMNSHRQYNGESSRGKGIQQEYDDEDEDEDDYEPATYARSPPRYAPVAVMYPQQQYNGESSRAGAGRGRSYSPSVHRPTGTRPRQPQMSASELKRARAPGDFYGNDYEDGDDEVDDDEEDQEGEEYEDDGNMFYNHGANLPPSRWSGRDSKSARGVNQIPTMVDVSQVRPSRIQKRHMPIFPNGKVSKRSNGASDPENIRIVNLREHGLTWEEIVDIMNAERAKRGASKALTVCAVTARYGRTAPVLYKAAGREYKSPKERRMEERGNPPPAGSGSGRARGASAEPQSRIIWSARLDKLLVDLAQRFDDEKWKVVADAFNAAEGKDITPYQAYIRFAQL